MFDVSYTDHSNNVFEMTYYQVVCELYTYSSNIVIEKSHSDIVNPKSPCAFRIGI